MINKDRSSILLYYPVNMNTYYNIRMNQLGNNPMPKNERFGRCYSKYQEYI